MSSSIKKIIEFYNNLRFSKEILNISSYDAFKLLKNKKEIYYCFEEKTATRKPKKLSQSCNNSLDIYHKIRINHTGLVYNLPAHEPKALCYLSLTNLPDSLSTTGGDCYIRYFKDYESIL